MIIRFEQMDVEVEQFSALRWAAVANDQIGFGETMMEAIVDLREKLEEE